MSRFTNHTDGTPGPQGPAGADGSNGADGEDAVLPQDLGTTDSPTFSKITLTSNGAIDNIRIGDDVLLGDGNIANNLVIIGNQDPTQGGIVLGNDKTEQISSDGSNLNLVADNDIILYPGSSYAYLGTPTIGGETRIATLGDIEAAQASSFAETAYTVNGGSLGTQPTFNGAPLFAGSYTKTGNLVHFRVNVNMSNITSFGTGQYYVSIPFTSEHDVYVRNGQLRHSSGDMYSVSGHATAGSNELLLYTTASNGKEVPFTSSSPVGLNTTCDFHIFGSYFAIVSA